MITIAQVIKQNGEYKVTFVENDLGCQFRLTAQTADHVCVQNVGVSLLPPQVDAPIGDFIYHKSNGEVILVYYIGEEKNIKVPNVIENLPVTLVAATCFDHTNVMQVELSDNITRIG